MRTFCFPIFGAVFFCIFLLNGCGNRGGIPEFPEGAEVYKPRYSTLFKIAYTESDTFLRLMDPADSTKTLGNFCWGKSDKKQHGFTRLGSRKQLVALSAVFVGMAEALHRENLLVAVDNTAYITSPRTVKRISQNQVRSVAPTGDLNKEEVAKMHPDAVIGYFIDQKGKEELQQLEREGIPVLFFQNFLEKHPLGRAEWLLVFGALTGNWNQATAQFNEIEEHYLATEIRAKQPKIKPTVMCNAPFTGIWDVPSGDSYMAKLIEDAGGRYVYSDHRGAGRIPLGIEKVFTRAGKADYWLNPGPCRDSACLLLMDKRLAGFDAYKNKNVYNSTKMQNSQGANAWWEYGVLRPDLALLDVFTILHPEIANEHELVFFEKIH
jgi:iron complex transport system substrate-binding protein